MMMLKHKGLNAHLPCDMSEIVASHLRRGVILRSESKQAPAENTSKQRPENDVKCAGVELRRAPCSEQDADDRDASTGDLEQSGLVAREAEAFDQNRLETTNRSVRNRSRNGDDREKPSLRIGQALYNLVGFEVLVLDTGLVLAQSFDGCDFLCVGQFASRHRVVGQEEDDNGAHGDCNQAYDEEHDLPGAEEGSGVVLEAEGH